MGRCRLRSCSILVFFLLLILFIAVLYLRNHTEAMDDDGLAAIPDSLPDD